MREMDLTALIPPASASGARRGWRCKDEARLVAYVEGRLRGAPRKIVEDHLADCAFCLGQVGFLARAGQLGPPPAVPTQLLALARGERLGLIGHLRPATLVAATVGIVLALAVVSPRVREAPLSGISIPARTGIASSDSQDVDRLVRGGRGPAAAPRIVRPSEGESILRSSFELRWEETPGALFYTIQLVDLKGDVVWEGRTESARLTLPGEAALAPGQSYFAWVLAHLRSGATVRSSAVGFRVAPG